METILRIDPHKPSCIPNPGGQEGFAKDWSSFICAAEGGWFSGKTYIGARKHTTLHIYNAFDKEGSPTYVPSVIIAPTYSNAMDFMIPELEACLDEINLTWEWHGQGSVAEGRYAAPAIVLPDLGTAKYPSVVLIRTADVPQRITGWQVGNAWGDEPARWKENRSDPRLDPLIQLIGRVRHPQARIHQINLTYTNEGDQTRVYELINSGQSDVASHRMPTRENPTAKSFIDRQANFLSPELRRQYLDGEALSMRGGKLYPTFDTNKHTDERLVLKDDLPLHLSLDFNIDPGMHGEVGQYYPGKDLFTVVYELHGPLMTVEQLIEGFALLCKELSGGKGFKWPDLEIYGDAQGHQRQATTGKTSYDVIKVGLEKHNIPFSMKVPRASPAIIDRVNTFGAALMDVHGGVHWKCHPRCKRLIVDMKDLQRDPRTIIDKRNKTLSHASDAESYRVYCVRPIRLLHIPKGRHSVMAVA